MASPLEAEGGATNTPAGTLSDNLKGVEKAQELAEKKAIDENDVREMIAMSLSAFREEIEDKTLMTLLKRVYGFSIIAFFWIYFLLTIAAILASTFKWYGFELNQAVLIALIGGTAVSVLSVVGTVAGGLFKSSPALRKK